MNPDEYEELLRKMGIGEDQFKYFTTGKEELPGLFGFTGDQSKRFSEQFGGMPKFDPSKAMQAYGEVERYGKERTADIGQQVKSGISGVQSGLLSGMENVAGNIGRGFAKSGARQQSFSDVRGSGYEAGSDVKRKGTMALSNLAESLGQRRAAVGKKAFDYLGNLMNLSGSLYGLDPGDKTPSDPSSTDSGYTPKDISMPDEIESRFASSQLIQYFQANNINLSGDEELFNKYISEYAKARKIDTDLTVDSWWKNTYGAN